MTAPYCSVVVYYRKHRARELGTNGEEVNGRQAKSEMNLRVSENYQHLFLTLFKTDAVFTEKSSFESTRGRTLSNLDN